MHTALSVVYDGKRKKGTIVFNFDHPWMQQCKILTTFDAIEWTVSILIINSLRVCAIMKQELLVGGNKRSIKSIVDNKLISVVARRIRIPWSARARRSQDWAVSRGWRRRLSFNVFFVYDWRAVKNLQINHTSYWNNNEHYESLISYLVVYLGRALAVVPVNAKKQFG